MSYSPSDVVEHASIIPQRSLALLSQREVMGLCGTREGPLYETFRRCALAVMSSGIDRDDACELVDAYPDFRISLEPEDRGIRLHVYHAPAKAFVGGEMIRGLRQQLFSVLRDLIYVANEIEQQPDRFELSTSAGITDTVFRILRHAELFLPQLERGVIACWGGHAIGRREYEYTKEVGYELGLRRLDIATGCGPGAMKGPMKGAAIGHAKQHLKNSRYIGVTEPGIIVAEPPNPMVNQLVILPDIEKRLEAFVRLAHGIVIFPGGVGTAEEILYLLGVLSHPDNEAIPYPVILTGPKQSAAYFEQLNGFIDAALGKAFSSRYRIIIGDPPAVADEIREAVDAVLRFRDINDDAPYFNWLLHIDEQFQRPFTSTHEAMAELELSRELPAYRLAGNLRRVFSGVVSGNVKQQGMREVAQHGPFEITGEADIMHALDLLLQGFVHQGRMRLSGHDYVPCYRLV